MNQTAPELAIPHLRRQGNATQLIVDGRPFLVLGGELHNSSASSLEYMGPIWERMVALRCNTVLAVVSWELVEPEEGQFDWSLVDGLIRGARRHGLSLILLWFGSWKNGMSSYVPQWVKNDYSCFPLAKRQDGASVAVLSTLAEENWQADARAFAAFMRRLREVDGQEHTVVMVQVENEVGLLGDSRDHSARANSAFAGPVPAELMAHLQRHQPELHPQLQQRWEAHGLQEAGSWEAVFGDGIETDELFMAWNYACYVDRVTAAGKAEYALPMFANAWLDNPGASEGNWASGGQKPGDWPSGGPLPHTLDVWLAGAPHVDMLCPDIYVSDFEERCRRYSRRDNPLFIPEMRRGADGARLVFAAIGGYNAIGVSPFGIDSILDMDEAPIRQSYDVLQQVAPVILRHQGTGSLAGVLLDEHRPDVLINLGGYELHVSLDFGFGSEAKHGYGVIIADGADSFIGAGYGFMVAFRPTTPGPGLAGIAAVDEGAYRNGAWVASRRLNGDETLSGKAWRFPPLAAGPRESPIPLQSPGTAISHCKVYRYE